MGATNALAAYVLYARKVPPLSMQVLVYMALVSKDIDDKPWYGQGHAALAAGALRRPLPIERPDIKAVERAIQPLLAAKAITVERRASGKRDAYRTVRYRLELSSEALFDLPPETGGSKESIVPRNPGPSSPGNRPIVPRKPAHRPPETGGLRNTRRHEELQEEEGVDIRTDVTVPAHLRIRRARIA